MTIRRLLLMLVLVLGVFTALAQDNSTNTVSFNGFSFSVPASVAANVNISQYPGDPPTLGQPGR